MQKERENILFALNRARLLLIDDKPGGIKKPEAKSLVDAGLKIVEYEMNQDMSAFSMADGLQVSRKIWGTETHIGVTGITDAGQVDHVGVGTGSFFTPKRKILETSHSPCRQIGYAFGAEGVFEADCDYPHKYHPYGPSPEVSPDEIAKLLKEFGYHRLIARVGGVDLCNPKKYFEAKALAIEVSYSEVQRVLGNRQGYPVIWILEQIRNFLA